MKKTFKIGEYAKGGIVEVEINDNICTVTCKDLRSKEVVEQRTFNANTNREAALELDLYLATEVTTSYYAEKMIEFIKANMTFAITPFIW